MSGVEVSIIAALCLLIGFVAGRKQGFDSLHNTVVQGIQNCLFEQTATYENLPDADKPRKALRLRTAFEIVEEIMGHINLVNGNKFEGIFNGSPLGSAEFSQGFNVRLERFRFQVAKPQTDRTPTFIRPIALKGAKDN